MKHREGELGLHDFVSKPAHEGHLHHVGQESFGELGEQCETRRIVEHDGSIVVPRLECQTTAAHRRVAPQDVLEHEVGHLTRSHDVGSFEGFGDLVASVLPIAMFARRREFVFVHGQSGGITIFGGREAVVAAYCERPQYLEMFFVSVAFQKVGWGTVVVKM